MIYRTYVVKTPDTDPFIDICVAATMGTQAKPVASPGLYPPGTVTPPPAGWVSPPGAGNSSGAYYELRGRSLRLEARAGQTGFTPRANLGFQLVVTPYGAQTLPFTMALTNGVQLSASLLAALGGDSGAVIPLAAFPDPSYGPVIRLFTPTSENSRLGNPLCLVHFSVAENKDEDFQTLGHA